MGSRSQASPARLHRRHRLLERVVRLGLDGVLVVRSLERSVAAGDAAAAASTGHRMWSLHRGRVSQSRVCARFLDRRSTPVFGRTVSQLLAESSNSKCSDLRPHAAKRGAVSSELQKRFVELEGCSAVTTQHPYSEAPGESADGLGHRAARALLDDALDRRDEQRACLVGVGVKAGVGVRARASVRVGVRVRVGVGVRVRVGVGVGVRVRMLGR